MTMDSPDTVAEISRRLFKCHETVTYSSLSQTLNISVDESKHVLADFYRANKHKAKCNFLISGTKDSSKTFKIAPDDSIDKILGEFASVDCVHVYSLVSNEFSLSLQDISLHELKYHYDHSQIDQLVKNGMIQGPPHELPSDNAAPVVPVKREAPAVVEEPKPAKKVKSSGLTSKYVSRKATKPNDDQPKFLAQKKAEPAKSTSYTYKSRKPQNHDKVVISEAHEEPEESIAPKANKTYSTELQNIFDDDFSDLDSNDVLVGPEENGPDLPVIEEKNRPPTENFLATTDNEDVEVEDVEEEPEAPTVREEVDEDGYIITYKVLEAKKPKASKPANKPLQRPATDSKPASNKKKQTSLMNFFGKKAK